MKTNILFLVLIIFITACDNFLDIQSETTLSSSSFYQTQADFEQAINGVYEPLRSLYNNAYVMSELRSDNSNYDYNQDNRGQIREEYIADFIEDAANSKIGDRYTRNYLVIARANQILAVIDDVEFEESNVKDNIKGQASFLRAFAYFDLVQNFGSVPLHLTPATNLEETALPLSDADAIYQQIIIDAEQAISLLPEKSDQELGRVTKGAARMLLGNVYINQKNWSDAIDILQDIETSDQYSILPDYANVFDPANKNNAESIFEIQFMEGSDGYNSGFFYKFIPSPLTREEIGEITGLPESATQSTNDEGYNIPTPDIIEAYEAGDLREDITVDYIYVSAVDDTVPFVAKYRHTHAQFGNTNDNWPIYRYSEVLLFLAEAINESGDGDPLPYLNEVRSRAGLEDITTTSQAELRAIILHERRMEFAFENKRWYDLVRTGNAETVMKAYGERVKANPQDYYFPIGTGPVPSAYTQINTVYPIPAEETSLNPNF